MSNFSYLHDYFYFSRNLYVKMEEKARLCPRPS